MASQKTYRARPKKSATSGGAGRSSALATKLGLIVVVFATLLVFAPVCGHEFLTWDDLQNVARNPHFNPPTIAGVLYYWAHPYMAIYIPLTYSVWGGLAEMAWLGTPDAHGLMLLPSVFHTANLVVHLFSAALAFLILLRLVGRPWPACAGALVFAIHPVQVESVAWVAGMKDVLAGCLSLAALWQYVCAARTPIGSTTDAGRPASWRTAVHYALATTAFCLAMLAKPSAVTVPLAALLLDRWVLRRRWASITAFIVPWLVLAVPIALFARYAQPVANLPDSGRIWMRPFLAADALAFYLYKIIFPVWLGVQYHHAPRDVLGHLWIYFTWLVPAAVAVLVWACRRSAPWGTAAAGLMVAGTLPVLGLVPFEFERVSLVSDHYLYVAMLGPALAAAFLLTLLPAKRVAAIVTAACLAILGARSWVQTWYWQDTVTLFEHTLSVNPDSDIACITLATQSMKNNHAQDAVRYATQAVRLRPQDAEAYLTLGSAQMAAGRDDEAASAYRRACDLAPNDPVPYASQAGLLQRQGRLDQAMQLCNQALKLDSNSVDAHLDLGVILFQLNRRDEALRETETAVHLGPDDPRTQTSLADLLSILGQRDRAIEHYVEALSIDPTFEQARRGYFRLTGSMPP